MRYDDWDVILFPGDSHVPIQEFKTVCHSTTEYGRQLPVLTCYISSLPTSTPFRISVHSWATAAKPSAIMESRRSAHQKIVYMVQVIVDEARVFRGFFDITSKWPQEIAHERRSISSSESGPGQRKSCLEFPPFHQHMLAQPVWEARDLTGRINIVLSEQLMSKTGHHGEIDLGFTNDIVCYSFQHAPKEVLEQTGIAWPIRNPLYFPGAHDKATKSTQSSGTSTWAPKPREPAKDALLQSQHLHAARPVFARPQIPEPPRKPSSQPPAPVQAPNQPLGTRAIGRRSIWEDGLGSWRDPHEDASTDSWSSKRDSSNSTGNVSLNDFIFKPSRPGPPWAHLHTQHEPIASPGWDDYRPKNDRDGQVVTLREDQFGQIIEALSPPKKHRDLHSLSSQQSEYEARPPTAHAYYPPKIGNPPRPSAAVMTGKISYPGLGAKPGNAINRESPDKLSNSNLPQYKLPMMYHHPSLSSNKENRPPSQSRLPTPFPYANRVPTPNPFAPGLPQRDSEMSMRDNNPVYSAFPRLDGSRLPVASDPTGNPAASHAPPSTSGIKSRKEGMLQHHSPHPPDHDQLLLPSLGSDTSVVHKSAPMLAPRSTPKTVEIIDVDALDTALDNPHTTESLLDAPEKSKLSPFKPNHKAGMSSMDSTGRLERTLFSALGEELGAFDSVADVTGGTEGFESVGKRKRGGGEMERSPVSKREKGGN